MSVAHEHYNDADIEERPVDWQHVMETADHCVSVKADFLRQHFGNEIAEQYLAEHRQGGGKR